MSEPYITIPNWKRFQHYKDGRAPSWIKTYLELLSTDEYLDLSAGDRGVLHGAWILAATDRNNAEKEVAAVSLRRCRSSLRLRANILMPALERLNRAGWIGLSLEHPYQNSRAGLEDPRTSRARESRTETEEPSVLQGQSENPEGGSANSNGTHPGEPPDHEHQPDELHPINVAGALVPKRDHLTSLTGELGTAVDQLLHLCHDRDAGTPKVIDKLAAPLNPAEVYDAIQAVKAKSPASPTRYAVRVLQARQAVT